MTRKTAGMFRAAGLISSLTLLSRVLGFFRDMAIAYVLGAGATADVFFVAFRVPNLFRRLYGEGSLSLPYMPELGRSYAAADDRAFALLASNLRGLVVSFYLCLVLLGVAAAPLIVSVLAPGFIGSATKWRAAVNLSRYLFPYIFCIGLAGFAMALLNTGQHFAAPAVAPALLNLSMLALLGLGSYFKIAPEWALAWGVLLGGVLQLGLQWYWVRRLVSRWDWGRWWRAPEVLGVIKLLIPTVIGAAVYHLNIFVATLFASFLTMGSISYLYYAERLIQFPLGLFGGAVGTAVLPRLTRQSALHEWSAFRMQVVETMELLWFLTIPAAAGLWTIRLPLVQLLFQRGEFNRVSTLMTAEALGYYALGLWAAAGFRVLVGAWYALGRAYVTVWTGGAALAVNMVLSAVLLRPLQHGGLALATSVAAVLNLLALLFLLGKQFGGIEGRRLLRSGGSCLAASLLMAMAVHAICRLSYGSGNLEGGMLALALGGWMVVGVILYLLCMLLLGMPEGVKKIWASRNELGQGAD